MAEEVSKKKQSLRYADPKKYYEEQLKDEKLGFLEGRTEVENEILRLRAVYGMSEAEVNSLKTAAGDVPSFPMYSDKTVDKMSWGKRKDYKKDKKAYLEKKQKWEQDGSKAAWDSAVQRAIQGKTAREERRNVELTQKLETEVNREMRVSDKRNKVVALTREKQHLYPTIEATPDAMDAALLRQDTKEMQASESEISQNERGIIFSMGLQVDEALHNYMGNSDICHRMNNYFRFVKGVQNPTVSIEAQSRFNASASSVIKNAEDLHEAMSQLSLSRDIVTRRGVTQSAIVNMLGLKATDVAGQKAELMRRFREEKPLVCSDKGFVSTACGSKEGYRAEGLELIILNRKGTHAANFSAGAHYTGESEVLLDAGTQFKVVGVYFNDANDPDSQREISLGDKGSWKIYLETIPQTDTQGTPR